MTDTEQSAMNETGAELGLPSPGEMLREGRKKMGLSSQEVAERLRLRLQIVEDLEQDKFNKYMAGTFTRGYLRAYARLVQVDEDALFKAYESLNVEEPQPDAMQSFSRRRSEQSQDTRLMALTYVIGAVIIGSAVIFWLQNSASEEPVDENELTFAERVLDEQDPQVELSEPTEPGMDTTAGTSRPAIFIDETLLSNETNAQPERSAEQPEQAEVQEEQPATPAATEPTQEETTANVETRRQDTEHRARALEQQPTQAATDDVAPPALPEGELVLAFSGDCWIRIEDANGDAIAFGVKPEGHVISLNGDAPYEVTLGAPEVVTMRFRGEEIDLDAYRPGRVARITLPQSE